MSNDTDMAKTNEIPEALRKQLSKAGRTARKTLGKEHYVELGKRSWAARMRKAKEAEAAKAAPEQTQP